MNKKIVRIEFKIQCCKGIIWYLNVQFSIVILIQINKAVLIKGFIEIDMHTKAIYIFTMIVPWFRIYDDIFLPEVLRSFQVFKVDPAFIWHLCQSNPFFSIWTVQTTYKLTKKANIFISARSFSYSKLQLTIGLKR